MINENQFLAQLSLKLCVCLPSFLDCPSVKLITFLGHLSQVTYCYGLASIVRHGLTSSSQEILGQSVPNLVCSIGRVRRQETVNFTPRGGYLGVKSVKLMYILKIVFSSPEHCSNDEQGRV